MWCATRNAHKAMKLQRRFVEAIGRESRELTVYYDEDTPGYTVRFYTTLHGETIEQYVVDAMMMCQEVGDGWVLLGKLRERRLSFYSGKTRISGVVGCYCHLEFRNRESDESIGDEQAGGNDERER